MLFPYFRNVSTTIEDLDSRHRDLSGTASIYILRNQISVQRDLSGVPSSAGEEPERGRTVKRFRCPLRLPVRHKLSLRAIAAVSDGDLQAQTSGPPATDPETPIDCLSTLIHYPFIDCAALFSSAIFTRLRVSGSKKVAVILTFCRLGVEKYFFACVDGPGL